MLRELGIRHFVLIEDLRLVLEDGLNVLTGETGAGKSIVLEAVGLLLGDRFSAESVRQGAERASVDGVFDAPESREFRRWWEEKELGEAEEILIRREGYPDGRSKAFLNDRPVTLATLEELGAFLVDVHGQNDHQQILKPAVQLALLDRFAGLEDAAARVAPLCRAWKTLSEQVSAGVLSEQERNQRIDLLRFQADEIDKARLQPGEEEALAARLPELKNAEKLRRLAETAYDALYLAEGSALERLGQAERAFDALAQLAPNVQALAVNLRDAKSRLDDTARELHAMAERWESDPAALEALLSRQDLIGRLKKKYGASVDAVRAHAQAVRAELDRLENAEGYRKDLEKQAALARETLEKASLELSAKRQKAAKELGASVQKQLGELGLKQALFACRIARDTDESGALRFSFTGVDRVVFEWSPNPGEGARPLKLIASGGEMSRVMLAVKTVLAGADAVPTLVFDEIDAGIGGVTAHSVGKKLRALARHHQLLCVSHLPQIASCADAHFHVSKRVSKARTFALVERLGPDSRVEEIARMLGSEVTPTSRAHARELLEQNQ